MRTVLITGSDGIIGSVLRDGLSDRYQIRGVNLPEDISSYETLWAQMAGVDTVIHLARELSPVEDPANPRMRIYPQNVQIDVNIFTAVVKAGVKRLILASSVHADNHHDPALVGPLTVPGSYYPATPYGVYKLIGEEVGKVLSKQFAFEFIGVRFGGVTRDDSVKRGEGQTATWLSHDDLVSAIDACLATEPLAGRSTVFYAVSNNADKIHDTTNPFGWRSKDNSADRSLRGKHRPVRVTLQQTQEARMQDIPDKADHFLGLHEQEHPLLLANAWDAGSAKLLASLGFRALATTSSGYAATLGRLDYSVDRDEAVAHAAALVAATDVPVSADFENGFAEDPAGVAETVRLALEVGLAGCSVEDWDGVAGRLYDADEAAERVAAAAQVAHGGPVHLVLTARAENHLRGKPDLRDTIARLQAYQEAGADVLYAPALDRVEDIRALVGSVDRPVNVLARPGVPSVADLTALGVKRVSVGGALAFAALGAAADAVTELLVDGTYGFMELSHAGAKAARKAFAD